MISKETKARREPSNEKPHIFLASYGMWNYGGETSIEAVRFCNKLNDQLSNAQ